VGRGDKWREAAKYIALEVFSILGEILSVCWEKGSETASSDAGKGRILDSSDGEIFEHRQLGFANHCFLFSFGKRYSLEAMNH
jgi:hypothetical protein